MSMHLSLLFGRKHQSTKLPSDQTTLLLVEGIHEDKTPNYQVTKHFMFFNLKTPKHQVTVKSIFINCKSAIEHQVTKTLAK